MKLRIPGLVVVGLVVAALASPAAAQTGTTGTILEQVLVKVNGEIITKTEIEQRQIAALRQKNPNLRPDSDAALQKALNEVTPQVIVDGQAHGVGSDRGQLIALMQETTSLRQAQSVPLYLQEHDGLLRVELGEGSSDLGRGAGVWLLRVAKSVTVTVGRGENKGRQEI